MASAALTARDTVRHAGPIPGDPAELASAFALFNELSTQLSETYRVMEERVSELDAELHVVAEQRLQELQEKERYAARLQSLLTLLPAGVVVLDQRGRISECNPAAIELLGEPLEGMAWLEVIERAFAPQVDDGHEISLRDGRRVSISTRSLDGEAGQLVLLTDLTETRALQQRLARHQRLSEMGRMVSSLAHQIRTPLSAAMLYAGHLSERELRPAQIQRFAGKIMDRLTHLESQVKDMLIFVRGDVALSEHLTGRELMAAWEQALEAPLAAANVDCDITFDCPEAMLKCNRDALVGALMNLVNNAVQAGGKGVLLRLGCIHLGDRLCLSVADNGPGFDSIVADRLGEAFFTTKAQGTGLGLTVVRAVAQAHQGEFTIDSIPGQGTTACLILPVADNERSSS